MAEETFTIGIEEEYQIVDPQTGELRSHIATMLEEGGRVLGERVKPEMHQSVVEVGTNVCRNIKEARDDVIKLRATIASLAKRNGLAIVAAGTHPFSDWKKQDITPRDRYLEIVEDLQDVARGNLIFGLHVHIGVEDHDLAISLFNEARYFLPHILAFSVNSPFWLGRKTGLKSTRCSIFKQFPRTGIPDTFASWGEFDRYVQTLIQTGCVDNGKKIWWDIRPHTFFSTIEFRIMDIPANVNETIAIVALIQAIMAKLYRLRLQNQGFRLYSRALLEENKWRASRYGLDGKLIDFGKNREVAMRELAHELMDFVDDVLDDLGSRTEIAYLDTILRNGTGADRQLKVYEERQDLKAVVNYLIEETMHDVDLDKADELMGARIKTSDAPVRSP